MYIIIVNDLKKIPPLSWRREVAEGRGEVLKAHLTPLLSARRRDANPSSSSG